MEVIQDELQKNNVRIDIETLTEHIEYILNNYKDSYSHAVDRLTREEMVLDVRLVASVIRNTGRVEGSFIRELCAWGRSLTFRFMGLNLWDLL